jgi:glyoxylase-like metal-dependent hydrolase (beta-lactamase superfamily II)
MSVTGRFRFSVHNHGFFRLDGGSMFGVVPRTIWARLAPPDEDNRIRLATRSLLIDAGERRFLVDLGNGEKWPEKTRAFYAIENLPAAEVGLDLASVTDIILTHLHFDHAGGISRFRAATAAPERESSGPRVYVQADNYETARHPNIRERASYLAETVDGLEASRLELTRGSQEIFPGLWVHGGNGHTRGHQWVEVKEDGQTVVYPGDLIPTSHHVPLPYTMGYDMSAETLLVEKEDFLRRAVAGDWVVVFEHDPEIAAARLKVDERGRYALREAVAI